MNLPARTLVLCAATAAMIPGGAVRLHAQDAAAGLTIRAETRVVLVDAVATDKKGKFVRDLTAKDFRVWEDGKEQKISGFSLESSGVTPERPDAHYIALFFDTSSATQASQVTVRQQGIRFVEGFASPDRYMAVVDYNANGGLQIAQNLTTDRDQLRKALSQIPAGWSPTPIGQGDGARALGGRGGGGRDRPSAASSMDNSASRNMLASLRTLADSLAVIRGRKALVFFGGGVPLEDGLSSDLQATIDACNRANVAVYPVSPPAESLGGATSASASSVGQAPLVGTTVRGDVGGEDRSLATSLAEGTGGVAFVASNNLAESLGKVAQEQDQYYLLSYTPTADSAQGSCHELRVKVDRKDLEVRARKS